MGYGVIMMFPNTNHLLPVTTSPIPSTGETLEPVCSAAVLVMHHPHHSLPQHHSSRQQQQWSHSGNLGPGTVVWYQGCLLSTRLIQKIFVKLNMTKPLCTSYWASLPRLMIRRSKLIAGNKFLKQTYSIFPVRFNARKFKFTSFFILPQYIWTPLRWTTR